MTKRTKSKYLKYVTCVNLDAKWACRRVKKEEDVNGAGKPIKKTEVDAREGEKKTSAWI